MPATQRGSAGAVVNSANNVGNPTTLAPTLPVHQTGDLLLVYTACRSATPTVACSGWTQLMNVAGTNGRLALFGKIAASSSETNPSVVWSGMTTGTSGTPAQAQCAVFFNAQLSVDVVGTVENVASSTTIAASGTAITTLTSNDLVLTMSARSDDLGTWVMPSGFTRLGDALTTSGADMSFGWAYQIKAAAGSSAPADFSVPSGVAVNSSGIQVALKSRVPVTYYGVISQSFIFNASTAGDKPSVPPSVSVVDDFNRTDQSPPGGSWIGSVAGRFGVEAGQLKNLSTSSDIMIWDALPEVDQECAITVATPGTGGFQLWARRDHAVNTGYWLDVASSGFVSLTRRITGNNQGLGSISSFSIAAGDKIALKVDGDQLEFWHCPAISGIWELKLTRTDSMITTAGQTGIGTSSNSDSYIFDNWASAPPEPAEPVTYFGSLAMPVTFSKEVIGQRQTFGQIDRPFSFGSEIDGKRKVFGQFSLPVTFSKNVLAQRKTFGQFQSSFIFGKEISGRRITFGQIDLPINVGITTSGIRVGLTLYGAVTLPVTFGKDIRGQRKTFGQLLSPYIFGKSVAGSKKTFGQMSLPITVGISTAGFRPAPTLYGSIALPVIFGKDVRGQRKAFGQIALPLAFTKDVKGVRKTFGKIDLPIIFTKEAVGRKNVFGQLSMQTLFGKEIAGRRKTFSQVVLPLTFSKAVSGRKQTFGRVALPINANIVIAGNVSGTKKYGVISLPINFNKQVIAQRQTFGQVTAPFIFGTASQGVRRAFSEFELPINFLIDVESGPVGVHGTLDLELIFIMNTNGKVIPIGVILNDAENIYLGTELVEAVYVEDQKVWPQ